MQDQSTQQAPTDEKVGDSQWPTYQVGNRLDIDGVHFVVQRINVSSTVIRPVAQRGLSARWIMRLLRGEF